MGNDFSNQSFQQSQKKIFYCICLVGLVFIAKLFGGIFANSLALLSDSLHLITDFIALIISWLGLRLTSRPASEKYTFGYYRHSILTALINNIFLIIISIFILYKAILRYLNPVTVESTLMIVFSVLGIIINAIILYILKSNENMNVKSAFLHFVGDAVGDVSVLIGAIMIYLTNLNMIDTFLSAILSILILRSAIKMALECIRIFLESVPKDVEITKVKDSIKELPGVISVMDIHVWSLSREMIAMTAHVAINEEKLPQSEEIIHKIQHLLKDKFNISHTTIQIEQAPCSSCFHNKPDHKGQCTLCIDSVEKQVKKFNNR